MDMWVVILSAALLAGILGWTMTPFVNGILWFCDWREGENLNWGLNVFYAIAVPFAWLFAVLELYLVYTQ
jgi:hypothetical protein